MNQSWCRLCLLLDQLSGVFQETMNTLPVCCLKWQAFDSPLNVCQSKHAANTYSAALEDVWWHQSSAQSTGLDWRPKSLLLKCVTCLCFPEWDLSVLGKPFKIYFKDYISFVSSEKIQIWFQNDAFILSSFIFWISLIIFSPTKLQGSLLCAVFFKRQVCHFL